MIKGILFDFNGVIIDDEPVQMRAYQEILGKEGIALTEEEYYSCLGMDDATFIAAAYERAEKTPEPNKLLEITQSKTARWREMVTDELPLFPNIENFVRKMANDFALGIVSMAKREEIEFVLEKANLRDCFDIIVSAEDVSVCKPWLASELQSIQPKVLVCLGATAAKSVLGNGFRITQSRGEVQASEWCERTLASWHPSAILRVPEKSQADAMRQNLLDDLTKALQLVKAA